MKKCSRSIAKLLFTLYFIVISTGIATTVLFIPSLIGEIIQMMSIGLRGDILIYILIEGIFFLLPIFLFFFLDRLKNFRILFLLSFILVGAGYYLTFSHLPLNLFLIITIVVLIQAMGISYLWKQIFIKNQYQDAYLLLLPIVVVFFTAISELRSLGYGVIFNEYIQIGEFVRNTFNINIFFFDYSGFALLFLSVEALILTSIMFFVRLPLLTKGK